MSNSIAPVATANSEPRFFAVYEGGEWNARSTLDPDLDNYGPFPSRGAVWVAINSSNSDDELPLYEPTPEERATIAPSIIRLAEGLRPAP